MKECEEIRERLSAFIDDELPAREHNFIEEHLHRCPACAQEERSLRHVLDLLDGLTDESPSRIFTHATIHRASSWKRCVYVKKHILMPALTVLRSVFAIVLGPLEVDSVRGRAPVNSYLHSFDDFPPESLSSVYISLIQGEST